MAVFLATAWRYDSGYPYPTPKARPVIIINIHDLDGVHATLAAIVARFQNPREALKPIGDILVDFTKDRFAVSRDPYGTPWAPNSDTTLRKLLHSNKKNFTPVKGKVSARGQRVLANKKPLIGFGERLSTQIFSSVKGSTSVEVRSSTEYAAMHQFGGKKEDFPHLWGDIPARPFFPSSELGLPPDLAQSIKEVLAESLFPRGS